MYKKSKSKIDQLIIAGKPKNTFILWWRAFMRLIVKLMLERRGDLIFV